MDTEIFALGIVAAYYQGLTASVESYGVVVGGVVL
jgi:hypothetical protein